MFDAVAGPMILVAVLGGVVSRPRILRWTSGLPVFIPAGVGALIVLALGALGLIRPPDLLTIFSRVWDASFTLVGLFMLAASLEANHFFEWAALRLAYVAKGSPWQLYLLMCLLTIVVTACLGNDGAILGMTAIVAKLVKRAFRGKIDVWFPYIFATGFLADSFSGFIVPDNLTNIIVASTYHFPFITFALNMSMPMIFAAIVAIILFALRFNKVLFTNTFSYNLADLPVPSSVLKSKRVFQIDCAALVLLIVGHLYIGGVWHQPVTFVVMPVALIVLWFSRGLKPTREILRDAPWDVLVYALGMFVVITAAMTPGIQNLFLSIGPMHDLIEHGKNALGIFVTGGIMAALAALTNNLPATLVGVTLLSTSQHPATLALYAVILGVDIGPKLTPYGSLATLMWMGILNRQGVPMSWDKCFKENVWVTVFALAAALFGLLLLMWMGWVQ